MTSSTYVIFLFNAFTTSASSNKRAFAFNLCESFKMHDKNRKPCKCLLTSRLSGANRKVPSEDPLKARNTSKKQNSRLGFIESVHVQ